MCNVGIYCIEIGKRKYIGSTLHLGHRIAQHKSNLKCGRHCNPIMQSCYNKYKEVKVTVLKSFEYADLSTLRKLEKYLIEREGCDLNIQDPVTNITEKRLYQFNKQGTLLKEYRNVLEASTELNIGVSTIRHAANPNEKETKSGGGYLWSYTKEPPEYIDRRRKKDVVGITKSGELLEPL